MWRSICVNHYVKVNTVFSLNNNLQNTNIEWRELIYKHTFHWAEDAKNEVDKLDARLSADVDELRWREGNATAALETKLDAVEAEIERNAINTEEIGLRSHNIEVNITG